MQKAKNQKRGPGKAADRKAALSAQQTIPYLVMHPDGVCQLPGGLYTKTVEYEDINYSVASTEDQTAIFGGWSSFLNYFDTSLPFQLSFINRRSRSRNKYRVNIPQAQDDFNSVRAEFTGMLKNQIARSNNGIERSKYITFGLPADGDRGGPAPAGACGGRCDRQPQTAWSALGAPGRAGAAGPAPQPDAPRQPGAVPLLLAGHSQNRAGYQRLYRAGQLRLSAVPPVPGGPVLGVRLPICRSWLRSSPTSSWRKSWSWTRS